MCAPKRILSFCRDHGDKKIGTKHTEFLPGNSFMKCNSFYDLLCVLIINSFQRCSYVWFVFKICQSFWSAWMVVGYIDVNGCEKQFCDNLMSAMSMDLRIWNSQEGNLIFQQFDWLHKLTKTSYVRKVYFFSYYHIKCDVKIIAVKNFIFASSEVQ